MWDNYLFVYNFTGRLDSAEMEQVRSVHQEVLVGLVVVVEELESKAPNKMA